MTPSGSHDHMTWGTPCPPGALTRTGPQLWRTGASLMSPPALLPTAEKQEKVIMFEFLRFAFNSFTPPLRSSLWTSSVSRVYRILIYHPNSLEEDLRVQSKQKDECLLWGSFIILSLVMTGGEKGFAQKLQIVMQRENVVKQNRF